MPAERCDTCVTRSLGEVAVAVVPQKQLLGGSRDVEIGVSVGIEVAGDAARSSDGEVRARVLADIFETTAVVSVERRFGEAARAPPPRNLDDGVRVDGEEVELAVTVIVEPAQTRALHGGDVGCGIPPERSLPKVDTYVVGNVDELRRAARTWLSEDARLVGLLARPAGCECDDGGEGGARGQSSCDPHGRAAYAIPRAVRRRFA